MKIILKIIGGLLLLAALIVFFVKLYDKKHEGHEKDDETSTSQKDEYKWVIEGKKTISFTGEYQETIHFAKGKGLSFENSSEPYCVTNISGQEFCGEKGEDISPKLPGSNLNTELNFKSRNGKNGTVTIVIWVRQKKK